MATKELLTRIALKYDSYENWTKDQPEGSQVGKNLVLLKGELGICEIPSDFTANGDSRVMPTVLFKVGNGTSKFHELPWASAKAADVYGWAKSETVVLDGTTIKFKTGDKVNHSIDLSSFATDAEVESVRSALDARIVELENSVGSNGDIGKSVADHESRLDIIEGADTVDGSIAKALKDAKKYTDDREVEIKKYADQAETDAVATAKGYTDTEVKKVADALDLDEAALAAHIADKENPHEVTAAQVGLGNVDNKSVATIKSEFTGAIEAGNVGFVTGGAAHTAIEAAKTAANTYADGLNTAMDTRVDALEAAKTAQDTKNSQLEQAIADEASARATAVSDEATARDNADKAIEAKIGGSFDSVNTVAKAISDAQAAAQGAAKDYTDGEVKKLTEGAIATNASEISRVEGLVTAEKNRAEGIEGGLRTDVDNIKAFFATAEGETLDTALDTLKEIQDYLNGEGDATKGIIGRVAQAETDIDNLEKEFADGGRVKVAEAAIEALKAKDTELAGADDALGQRIDGVITDYKAADAETLTTAKGYADEKDGALKTELQGYADGKASAAQAAAEDTASKALASAVSTLNAKDTEIAGDVTALKQVTNGYSGDKAIKTAVDAKLDTDTFTTWKNGHVDGHAKSATEITKEITDAVNAEKSARESAVSGVDAKVTALDTRVGTAESNIITLQGIVTSGDNTNAKLREAITALEATVNTGADANATLRSDLTTLQGIINNATTGLAATKVIADRADAKSVDNASRIKAIEDDYLKQADEFIFNCGSSTEVVHVKAAQ